MVHSQLFHRSTYGGAIQFHATSVPLKFFSTHSRESLSNFPFVRTQTCTKHQEFFKDDTLHILVSKLLNCQNEQVSDKDTKLDVLAILANLVSAMNRLVEKRKYICTAYSIHTYTKNLEK